MTVRVSRGRPMPPIFASLLVLVGAAMVVYGIAVVGRIEVPGTSVGAIPMWLAVIILVPIWFFYLRSLVRAARTRRRAIADAGVPDTLTEPPSQEDPAVVAVLLARGSVPAEAAAATTLAVAAAGWIDIQEVGDRVVVSFDETPSDKFVASATDTAVEQALAARRDPTTGDVTGPPLYAAADGWWQDYAADARGRAVAAGLVEPRVPLVVLMLVCILTATVVALAIFWYVMAFVGLILLANGLPHLLVQVGGYRLSGTGLVERARWVAFGRGLRERGGLAEVGPGGVAVWGPYLVYGVLLGAAPRAAEALTPDVGRAAELPSDVMVFTTD